MLAKLDAYDYVILPGVIRIRVGSTNDPDVVDIMSEISRSGDVIYLEGDYYSYLDNYRLHSYNNESFIELDVVQISP